MHSGNLQEILVFLLAAIFVVTIFRRLNISPVLGYLCAGMAIGPSAFGIIQDFETTRYIGEFGVVFLLFYIGLELTFSRLRSMRKHIFGFGSLQAIITALCIGSFLILIGQDSTTAIIVGAGLALSSTAIVLQVLHERGEQASQVGRLGLAVLIMQDLAVVPLLILVPLLATSDANVFSVLGEALLKATIALGLIIIIGRRLLRPLFLAISPNRSDELSIATTLLIVLSTAWVTEQLGLSLALGAFIAGLLLAETEYRHQVEADIHPFKGLLMGLFFMTVGMSLDLNVLKEDYYTIAWISLLLVASKAFIIFVLCRLFRFRLGPSIYAGLLLAQGSEFAFIIFHLADTLQVLERHITQILMVSVTITMAFTPLLAIAGKMIQQYFEDRELKKRSPNLRDVSKETHDLTNHVIVAGFGRMGRTICKLLATEKMPYVALDSDPAIVHEARKAGFPVYYGSVTRPDILASVGARRANMVVITIRNRKESLETVRQIHNRFPSLRIMARAWDRKSANELREAGAMVALAEAFESSLLLGAAILRVSGVNSHEIERVIREFRNEEYPASLNDNENEHSIVGDLLHLDDKEDSPDDAAEEIRSDLSPKKT